MLGLLLSLLLLHHATCVCRQTYMTVCDSLSDVTSAPDHSWTDLIVQSQEPKQLKPLQMNGLYNAMFWKRIKVKSLTIVAQFTQFSNRLYPQCLVHLEYLSFYRNIITQLRANSLPPAPNLRKLVLISNSIETLSKSAFSLVANVAIIDLSDNLLEEIRSGVFDGLATEELYLRNNKLNFIEALSLPANLTVLDARNNSLALVQDDVIDYLVNLEAIYLDYNQMRQMPNIQNLVKLQVVSLSHNNINSINGKMFGFLDNLRVLDLSFNKISSVGSFLVPWARLQHAWKVSLAFNSLQTIEDHNLGNATYGNGTLFLYANPWWCFDWPNVEALLNARRFGHKTCEVKLENGGEVPYCVADSIVHDENQKLSVPKLFLQMMTVYENEFAKCGLNAETEKLSFETTDSCD